MKHIRNWNLKNNILSYGIKLVDYDKDNFKVEKVKSFHYKTFAIRKDKVDQTQSSYLINFEHKRLYNFPLTISKRDIIDIQDYLIFGVKDVYLEDEIFKEIALNDTFILLEELMKKQDVIINNIN